MYDHLLLPLARKAHRPEFNYPPKLGWLSIGVFLFLIAFVRHGVGGEISVAWDAVNDARLGGYELHYGLSPGSFNAMIDVGNTTNRIVTGLNAGTTYFFCVRAYSQDNSLVSNFSNEISATVSAPVLEAPVLELEMGEIVVDDEWQRVDFEQPFVDAIVVANALSADGSDPAVVRVDGIDANGFWIRVQEWDYLDGIHYNAEVVSYLVMENGSHQLADGSWVEAGRLQTSTTNAFDHTVFQDSFAVTPVVLTAVTSFSGGDAVTTQVRNIDSDGFEFGLREQEANEQFHVMETIDYIAWEPSSGVTDGLRYEVDRTLDEVTSDVHTIVYQSTFEQPPMFLANMQSTDGGDTANLRWRNKTAGAVDLWVDEEQSHDSETAHTTETVGYILLEFVN